MIFDFCLSHFCVKRIKHIRSNLEFRLCILQALCSTVRLFLGWDEEKRKINLKWKRFPFLTSKLQSQTLVSKRGKLKERMFVLRSFVRSFKIYFLPLFIFAFAFPYFRFILLQRCKQEMKKDLQDHSLHLNLF